MQQLNDCWLFNQEKVSTRASVRKKWVQILLNGGILSAFYLFDHLTHVYDFKEKLRDQAFL